MSGKASKDKGKAAERELCGIFSKYIGGNFERVAFSGAFIGGKNQFRKERMSEAQIRSAKSDIVPPDDMPKLVLESKFYASFPYHAFALNKDIPTLDQWIKELEYDCDPGDFGMLCVKINHKGWFACFKDAGLTYENVVKYKGYTICSLEKLLEDNKENIKKLSV